MPQQKTSDSIHFSNITKTAAHTCSGFHYRSYVRYMGRGGPFPSTYFQFTWSGEKLQIRNFLRFIDFVYAT